jgi:CO/xanthine dehydrogenase Mo-binding subunit
MKRALALADWQGFPARQAEARRRGRSRGIGIANFVEITTGAPTLPSCWLKPEPQPIGPNAIKRKFSN